MILRLIKKLLHHFNYEVVSFALMGVYERALNERADIAGGSHDLTYCVKCFGNEYSVQTAGGSPVRITVKWFKIEDYGSEEYARACAKELCDKLNEKP